MRTTFSIVAALSLALTGFAVFQIHVVGEYRARVQDVQFALSEESRMEVSEVRRRGAMFTGQTLGDSLSPKLDGVGALECGWYVVASLSLLIFSTSVFGVIRQRRDMTSDTMLGSSQ